jgi:hypothetical protein
MSPAPRVVYSESVRNQLKALHARAVRQGRGADLLSALRRIDDRLHSDPRLFGEPKYHYRALKLTLRVGIDPPLVVHYTVHDEQPLVFVKAIRSLPGQGF